MRYANIVLNCTTTSLSYQNLCKATLVFQERFKHGQLCHSTEANACKNSHVIPEVKSYKCTLSLLIMRLKTASETTCYCVVKRSLEKKALNHIWYRANYLGVKVELRINYLVRREKRPAKAWLSLNSTRLSPRDSGFEVTLSSQILCNYVLIIITICLLYSLVASQQKGAGWARRKVLGKGSSYPVLSVAGDGIPMRPMAVDCLLFLQRHLTLLLPWPPAAAAACLCLGLALADDRLVFEL